MAETDAWLVSLEADPGLQNLIGGLVFAEGVEFDLLVCETRRVANAALEIIRKKVSEGRGRAVELLVIDPYEGRVEPAPLPVEVLVDSVLKPLLEPELGPGHILAINAAGTPPRDEEAWAQLFLRMNLLRNTIVSRLKGPLLLCLTPPLEPIFAHAAPDFWSIRTTAVVIEVQVPMRDRLRPLPEPEQAADPKLRAEALSATEQAREQVSAQPGDRDAQLLLALRLARASVHLVDGAAEEGISILRRLLEQAPDRQDYLSYLAGLLFIRGLAQIQQGVFDEAVIHISEGIDIWRERISQNAGRYASLQVGAGLALLGEASIRQGKISSALKSYEEALAHLAQEGSTESEFLTLKVMILLRMGHANAAQGDSLKALSKYVEAQRTVRELLATNPEQRLLQRQRVEALAGQAAILFDQGALRAARSALEEAVATTRTLNEPPLLAVLLDNLATVLDASGNPAEAARLRQEAQQA